MKAERAISLFIKSYQSDILYDYLGPVCTVPSLHHRISINFGFIGRYCTVLYMQCNAYRQSLKSTAAAAAAEAEAALTTFKYETKKKKKSELLVHRM